MKLTKLENYDDLLLDHAVPTEELEEASETVIAKHKPVCLVRDGLSVMDDVGGLSGFSNFLKSIYEGDDKEEAASYRRWTKSMGWKQTKLVPKKVL